MMRTSNPASSEPRMDSRSALSMKNRRWRRLRIVKCNDSFSLIFSSRIGTYRVGIRVGGALGGPPVAHKAIERGYPPPRRTLMPYGAHVAPLTLISSL